MTALPNIEKHICLQVKQLPSFEPYHFRSERSKGRSIFTARPGPDRCSGNRSQLEAFVLASMEQVCALTHLGLRGPRLGATPHCPVVQVQTSLLAFIAVWALSSHSRCFSFGPAALSTCAQTTLSLGSHGSLIPSTAALLQLPSPRPCLYLREPNGPCFLASYIRLHLYCRCVYRIPRLDQHSLVSCVVSPVGGTGTLPCRGAELDGRGTSTHGAGSAGDVVSEEMWC